jgi:hypothetical protein
MDNNLRLFKFLVLAKAVERFFQVIVVRAESLETAVAKTKAFLVRKGATFLAFEDEDTEEVLMESIPPEMIYKVPTEEGVVAATGRVFAPDDSSDG